MASVEFCPEWAPPAIADRVREISVPRNPDLSDKGAGSTVAPMKAMLTVLLLIGIAAGNSVLAADDIAAEVAKLRKSGKWKEARAAAESHLKLVRGNSDASKAALLEALEIWTLHLRETQQFPEALAPSGERLELAKSLNTRVAPAMHSLALVEQALGKFSLAQPRALRALEACGEDEQALKVSILVQLGDIEALVGTPQKTAEYFAQISEAYPDPPADLAVRVAVREADSLAIRRLFDPALTVLKEAIDKLEEREGTTKFHLALIRQQMGAVLLEAGQTASAKGAIDDVFETIEDGAGQRSVEYASLLLLRGSAFKHMGSLADADRDLHRAYKLREELFGARATETLSARARWCGLLYYTDRARATREYEAMLPIALEVYGESGEYLSAASDLSVIYLDTEGREAEAIALMEDVLRGRLADVTAKPWQIILTIVNLVEANWQIGDYGTAGEHADKLAGYKEEIAALRPIDRMTVYSTLCYEAIYDRKLKLAQGYAALYEKAHHTNMREILSFAPTEERVSHASSSRIFYILGSTKRYRQLADVVLQQKGLVLDTIVREKRMASESGDPAVAALREELDMLQAAYRNSEFQGVGTDGLAELSSEISRVQQAITRKLGVGDFLDGMDVDAKQISAALPPDGALVEYLRTYETPLGPGRNTKPVYGAMIYQPGREPAWVRLGEWHNLNLWMWNFNKRMRSGSPQQVADYCRRLHDYIWRNCQNKISPKVEKLYISGFADINFMPFASLIRPDGKFLCEKYEIRYVNSGRDLLRQSSEPEPGSGYVIVGNPQFAGGESPRQEAGVRAAPVALTTAARKADIDSWFKPLPGAEAEARAIHKMVRERGEKSELLTGVAATESVLRGVRRPKVLHLATHGFWLFGKEKVGPAMGIFTNPMYRGGIALSDADHTFRTWRNGKMGPPAEDGVLLADEVAGLDLLGTWLVVMSACETGGGYYYGTEGKFGLERAFLQAGAENVLASIWTIPDKESAEFMDEFYTSLAKTRDPGKSLADVQRRRLVALRKSHGVAHAVRSAGGFMLNTAVGDQGPVTKLLPGSALSADFETADGDSLPWAVSGSAKVAAEANMSNRPAKPGNAIYLRNGTGLIVSGKIDLRGVANESVTASVDFRSFEDSANSDWEADDHVEAWLEGSTDGIVFSRLKGGVVIPKTTGNNAKTTHNPSDPNSDALEKLQLADGAYTSFASHQGAIPAEIGFIRVHVSAKNNSTSERFFFDNLSVRSSGN